MNHQVATARRIAFRVEPRWHGLPWVAGAAQWVSDDTGPPRGSILKSFIDRVPGTGCKQNGCGRACARPAGSGHHRSSNSARRAHESRQPTATQRHCHSKSTFGSTLLQSALRQRPEDVCVSHIETIIASHSLIDTLGGYLASRPRRNE